MKCKISLFYILFFVCVITIQSIYFLFAVTEMDANIMCFLLGVLFLSACFQLYHMIVQKLAEDKASAQLSSLKMQQEMEASQDTLLLERRDKTFRFRSELQGKLLEIRSLLEEHSYPQAHYQLAGLNTSFEQNRFKPYCSDSLVQAILDGKKLLAEKYHITVNYEILLPETSIISSVDLSSVVFNMMDNGIEACMCSDREAPELTFSARTAGGFLIVCMINHKDPLQKFDHQTTKEDPQLHGFGLSIIEDICQKYGGICKTEDLGETFRTLVVMRCED